MTPARATEDHDRCPSFGQVDEHPYERRRFVGLQPQPSFTRSRRGRVLATGIGDPAFETGSEIRTAQQTSAWWHRGAGLVHRATVRFARS
ncbi:MAG: hypothetical protein QOD92_677 [Acidimicrobiaceae bacterium]